MYVMLFVVALYQFLYSDKCCQAALHAHIHTHTHTSIVTWVNCSRLLLLLLSYKIECIWSTELYSPIECYKVCIRSVSATLQSAKRVCCQCYLLNIQNHMHEATLFCGQEGVSEKRD